MQVEQISADKYCIKLTDKEDVIVTVWANDTHISNEEVIEEWLSKAIEIHKILHPSSTEFKEKIKDILSEGKNDDG